MPFEGEQLITSIVASLVNMVKIETAMSNIQFNNNPKFINCFNRVKLYRQWVGIKSHNREHHHTSIITAAYDPMAEASRFKLFLSKVLNGDIAQAAKIAVLTPILLSHYFFNFFNFFRLHL